MMPPADRSAARSSGDDRTDETVVTSPQADRPGATLGQRRAHAARLSSRWSHAEPIPRDLVSEMHRFDRSPTAKLAVDGTVTILAIVMAALAWHLGYWLLTPVFWVIGGHFAFVHPLAFHDASHGTLHPNRRWNEFLGVSFGTVILVPFSLYRYAHAKHHTHLATVRDPELWPFNDPAVPRWVRIAAALFETFCGFLATPLLFLRAFWTADDIPADQRRRIVREYGIIIAVWLTAVLGVSMAGAWELFLVGYVGPWAIGGAFQTLNKYVEHMGMTGVGVVGVTRSIAAERSIGKAYSHSIQHVDFHATHHLYAKIPYYNLPAATEHVLGEPTVENAQYRTYLEAFFAMLKTLTDPRVGPQWSAAK